MAATAAAAATMVGGALLGTVLPYLRDKLDGTVTDYFKRRNLDRRLLKKLKNLMLSVQVLLGDAEEKQITSSSVKKWADDLRDAVCEAGDYLDEICYDAMLLEMEAGAPVTGCYKSVPFLNTFKWMKKKPVKLGEILDRLRDLVSQKDVRGLINRNQISRVNESLVNSRKKLLLSADAAVPIVGMGGVGKSILLIFFHKAEMIQLNLKAWV